MSAASSPNRVTVKFSPRCPPPPPPVAVGDDAPALAGVVPFSTVDWPGQLAAVLFIGGCPWRCSYCHNPHLQPRHGDYDWPSILHWLSTRRGLLDGVVFSGGEPLSESQLPYMITEIKALGFRVALHTAGIFPQRLADLLPLLDWVGLDIKHDDTGYDALTGRPNSYKCANRSLAHLLTTETPFECRTTWSPHWLSEGLCCVTPPKNEFPLSPDGISPLLPWPPSSGNPRR